MDQKKYYGYIYDTDAGKLLITDNGLSGSEAAITGVGFLCEEPDNDSTAVKKPYVEKETPVIRRAWEELKEYFAGKRREFDLPCEMHGTQFQKEVWKALLTIPYGETRTYGEIAVQIGRPKACRAVGQANHNNPVGIFVP